MPGRPDPRARRVVVKSRYALLGRSGGAAAAAAHLRYIERDGTTRDGRRGQAYGPDADQADLRAFQARGQGDRHQFRLIVSLEDAGQLETLRDFTREWMRRLGVDLQTPLDWVAVDHWDTDNPHTHIVLRGRVGAGTAARDLVIAPDYMAHGMRARASELVTEWLGPRTTLEIRQAQWREVDPARLTSLDRALRQLAVDGDVDLQAARVSEPRRALLRGRLARLQTLGLARPVAGQRWQLAPAMEQTLRQMGERGDIVRAMHRALRGEGREMAIGAQLEGAVTGRLAGKGMADELQGRGYAVVDGLDGRAHYLRLAASVDPAQLEALPIGAIVQARPVLRGHEAAARTSAARTLEICSRLGLERQQRALGATWLDGQLLAGDAGLSTRGFGAQVRDSLRLREDFLIEQGLAVRRAARVVLARDLLRALRERELAVVGRSLQARSGRVYRPLARRAEVAGVYRRSLQLTSGRFALIEEERGFSLLPWRPALERHRGSRVQALVEGDSVSWRLGRRRGRAL